MKRIGIFSGVFDPVHEGHIRLALVAAEQAGLDEVYFLLEVQPRRKTGVTHLAHRLAMIKLAIAKYPNLKLLDLPDRQLSVVKTIPRLKQKFKKDKLFYLVGSDMLEHMPDWPLINKMLTELALIIGLRQGDSNIKVKKMISRFKQEPDFMIIDSPLPKLRSTEIRQTAMFGKEPRGLKPEVFDYIKANWLYASPSNSSSAS